MLRLQEQFDEYRSGNLLGLLTVTIRQQKR